MNLKSKILITGATGFIGSNLLRILLNKGYENITCLVLPQDNIEPIKDFNINIEYGDITDKDSLYDVLRGIEVIIHLAAVVGSEDYELNNRVNYIGTKNIVEVIEELELNIERFLFASSIAASGPSKRGEVKTEKDKEEPISEYGKSKLKAEKYLLNKKDKIPLTIIRFPLVYGPGSTDGIFPLFKAIKNHLCPILPYNETNLCFVDDVCNGIIDAINSNRTIGEVFYVGEDKVYSSRMILKRLKKIMRKFTIIIPIPSFILYIIVWFVELYAKIFNKKPLLRKKNLDEYLNYRYWGVSINKAIEYFNYKTEFPLEKGLKKTFDWYKEKGIL